MKRLRARILALVALLSVVPFAGAATIEVTTFGESVDGDDLCSVREAFQASYYARLLRGREAADTSFTEAVELLDSALELVIADPGETYSRVGLLQIAQDVRTELLAHEPVNPADIATRDQLVAEADVLIAHLQLMVTDAGQPELEDAIALLGVKDDGTGTLGAIAREVERITARTEVDGCSDGSAADRIILNEGDSDYVLEDGEIVVRHSVTITSDEGVLLDAQGGSRHFSVLADASLTIVNLGLVNGLADDGGSLYVNVDGRVTLTNATFRGNRADSGSGGAVYCAGIISVDEARFEDNVAAVDGGGLYLRDDQATLRKMYFSGNTAARHGGALVLDGGAAPASFGIEQSSFFGGQAQTGAAVYVVGGNVDFRMTNSSIYNNHSLEFGALNLVQATGDIELNNLTVVSNTAANSALDGSAGMRVATVSTVTMYNSVLVFNAATNPASPVDCEIPPGAPVAGFQRNFYAEAGVSDCPGVLESTDPVNGTNFALSAGQSLADLFVVPFDASRGFLVPVYPGSPLIGSGAGGLETYRCMELDQRGDSRLVTDDVYCDIGAIEFAVAKPELDALTTLVDTPTCVDVISNDLGDSSYVPGSLAILAQPSRPGASVQVVPTSSCPSGNLDPVDYPYPEAILFTPAPGFRGEHLFSYELATTTTGVGTISGEARVVTDVARGITSSTLGLGSFGIWSLLASALLLLRSRAARIALAGLVGFSASAMAAENVIYVNSDVDTLSPVAGDGLCTLREALLTARNDQVNRTLGDCLDGIDGLDVIEISLPSTSDNTITLVGTLQSTSSVEVRCAEGRDCRIEGNNTFRLWDSAAVLRLKRLTLALGNAGAGEGGAISSASSLNLEEVVLEDNRARSGGAIFLRGARSDLSINKSMFIGNTSTGNDGLSGGGAIATTASNAHSISIYNSTFAQNTSATLAAALELNTTRGVGIANSTFHQNTSTGGAGAIDLGGALSAIQISNITVTENASGPGFGAIHFPSSMIGQISNSIIGANTPLDCSGIGALNGGWNLFGDTGGCAASPTDGDEVQPATYFLASFEPLAFNGGSTMTLAPVNGAVTGVVDAANPVDLSLGSLTGPACGEYDQRGEPRTSGGRCDRGAFELQQLTAVEDEGSNSSETGRAVYIDLLDNDVGDEATGFALNTDCDPADALSMPDCVDVDDSLLPAGASYSFVAGDDPAVGFTTDSPFVLRVHTGGVLYPAFTTVLEYRVRDSSGNYSVTSAPVRVRVSNIGPVAVNDTVTVERGHGVTINVLANDRDPDAADTPGGGGLIRPPSPSPGSPPTAHCRSTMQPATSRGRRPAFTTPSRTVSVMKYPIDSRCRTLMP